MITFDRIAIFIKKHRLDITFAAVVLVVAAIPRLIDLGVFLTADEKNWMGRSYEFIRAFKDWRFNDMLQTTHPGVTTMWVAGAAITAKMMLSHIPFSFNNLVHFVAAAQLPIALLNTLAVPALYVLLRLLLPDRRNLALIASLFMALDPFLIGYSRVVHVDALLASFLILAALAVLLYVERYYSRRWLVISALLAGLAILTKAPGVFIIPFFILAVFIKEKLLLFGKPVLIARLRDFTMWLTLIVILFLLAWPALLWVPNPGGNVLLLKRDIRQAAITPHNMVEDYTLNPWHYPATLLARSTPINLALVIISVLGLVGILRRQGLAPVLSRTWLLLLAYVLFFGLMMTLGAKKGDRYILPVFPALDLLAALGLVTLHQVLPGKTKRLVAAFGILLVLMMSYTLYRYHPYTIAYSNPLFPDNLSQELGWGEGLEQVGAWLSAQSDKSTVASWYPEELAAYTSADVVHINAHEQGQIGYVVLYRNMFGRAPDHPASNFIDEYYNKREPVFVARVIGKEFAWVYKKKTYTQVVGELVAGRRVGQTLTADYKNLGALDILTATYKQRAKSGTLKVALKDKPGGQVLQQWDVPVQDLEDDKWLTLPLPVGASYQTGQSLWLEVYAEGTSAGDAPTIRFSSKSNYRPTGFVSSDSGQLTAKSPQVGDLAVRLRYFVGNTLATEDDTKILEK